MMDVIGDDDTAVVEAGEPITRYQWYDPPTAIRAWAPDATPLVFNDGTFVIGPTAILCFFTLGDNTGTYAASPSQIIWRPPPEIPWTHDPYAWLPPPVRDTSNAARQKIKHHYLFLRPQDVGPFMFVGPAHLGSYGVRNRDRSATFNLKTTLPWAPWLAIGGSLAPPALFPQLKDLDTPPLVLRYHQQALHMLRLPAHTSPARQAAMARLDERLGQSLPAAIREWYVLDGAYDILREVAQIHVLAILEDDGDDAALRARYAATGPSATMLPLVYENQGVWHLAVPLDAGDDPPVYLGYQEAAGFEWHWYADRFSDWVWAWVWDYVGLTRDYQLFLRSLMTDTDCQQIRTTFQHGPRTMGTAWIRAEQVERYYQGEQRVTLYQDQGSIEVELHGETAAAMETFLMSTWSQAPLRPKLGAFDMEMQKAYLR
jgi:hypothetical protein